MRDDTRKEDKALPHRREIDASKCDLYLWTTVIVICGVVLVTYDLPMKSLVVRLYAMAWFVDILRLCNDSTAIPSTKPSPPKTKWVSEKQQNRGVCGTKPR